MSTVSVSTSAEIARDSSGTTASDSDAQHTQASAGGSINSIMNLIYPNYQEQATLGR